MSSLPESELPYYFQIKLVDEIKALALDFSIQKKLIPSQFLWNLAVELLDDWDNFYTASWDTICIEGLLVGFSEDFVKIDAHIKLIIKQKSYSLEDLKSGKSWDDLRLCCRSLLGKMGEENNFPDSWKPGWRFFGRENYGVFDDP